MVKFNSFYLVSNIWELSHGHKQQLMAPPVHCMLNSDIFNDENTEEKEYIATLMMTNIDKKEGSRNTKMKAY